MATEHKIRGLRADAIVYDEAEWDNIVGPSDEPEISLKETVDKMSECPYGGCCHCMHERRRISLTPERQRCHNLATMDGGPC